MKNEWLSILNKQFADFTNHMNDDDFAGEFDGNGKYYSYFCLHPIFWQKNIGTELKKPVKNGRPQTTPLADKLLHITMVNVVNSGVSVDWLSGGNIENRVSNGYFAKFFLPVQPCIFQYISNPTK